MDGPFLAQIHGLSTLVAALSKDGAELREQNNTLKKELDECTIQKDVVSKDLSECSLQLRQQSLLLEARAIEIIELTKRNSILTTTNAQLAVRCLPKRNLGKVVTHHHVKGKKTTSCEHCHYDRWNEGDEYVIIDKEYGRVHLCVECYESKMTKEQMEALRTKSEFLEKRIQELLSVLEKEVLSLPSGCGWEVDVSPLEHCSSNETLSLTSQVTTLGTLSNRDDLMKDEHQLDISADPNESRPCEESHASAGAGRHRAGGVQPLVRAKDTVEATGSNVEGQVMDGLEERSVERRQDALIKKDMVCVASEVIPLDQVKEVASDVDAAVHEMDTEQAQLLPNVAENVVSSSFLHVTSAPLFDPNSPPQSPVITQSQEFNLSNPNSERQERESGSEVSDEEHESEGNLRSENGIRDREDNARDDRNDADDAETGHAVGAFNANTHIVVEKVLLFNLESRLTCAVDEEKGLRLREAQLLKVLEDERTKVDQVKGALKERDEEIEALWEEKEQLLISLNQLKAASELEASVTTATMSPVLDETVFSVVTSSEMEVEDGVGVGVPKPLLTLMSATSELHPEYKNRTKERMDLTPAMISEGEYVAETQPQCDFSYHNEQSPALGNEQEHDETNMGSVDVNATQSQPDFLLAPSPMRAVTSSTGDAHPGTREDLLLELSNLRAGLALVLEEKLKVSVTCEERDQAISRLETLYEGAARQSDALSDALKEEKQVSSGWFFQLEALKELHQQMTGNHASTCRDLQTVGSELSSLRAQFATATEQMAVLRGEKAQVEVDRASLDDRFRQLSTDHCTVTTQLEEQLQASQQARVSNDATVARLNGEVQVMQERLRVAEETWSKEISGLQTSLDELVAQKEELKVNAEKGEYELGLLQREMADYQATHVSEQEATTRVHTAVLVVSRRVEELEGLYEEGCHVLRCAQEELALEKENRQRESGKHQANLAARDEALGQKDILIRERELAIQRLSEELLLQQRELADGRENAQREVKILQAQLERQAKEAEEQLRQQKITLCHQAKEMSDEAMRKANQGHESQYSKLVESHVSLQALSKTLHARIADLENYLEKEREAFEQRLDMERTETENIKTELETRATGLLEDIAHAKDRESALKQQIEELQVKATSLVEEVQNLTNSLSKTTQLYEQVSKKSVQQARQLVEQREVAKQYSMTDFTSSMSTTSSSDQPPAHSDDDFVQPHRNCGSGSRAAGASESAFGSVQQKKTPQSTGRMSGGEKSKTEGNKISNDIRSVDSPVVECHLSFASSSSSSSSSSTLTCSAAMPSSPVTVLFSGFKDGSNPNCSLALRAQLQSVVEALGGIVIVDPVGELWLAAIRNISHLVTPQGGIRTEKTLSAAVLKKWVVSADWVFASKEAGHFVSEVPYGNGRLQHSPFAGKVIYMDKTFSLNPKNIGRPAAISKVCVTCGEGSLITEEEVDLVEKIDYFMVNSQFASSASSTADASPSVKSGAFSVFPLVLATAIPLTWDDFLALCGFKSKGISRVSGSSSARGPVSHKSKGHALKEITPAAVASAASSSTQASAASASSVTALSVVVTSESTPTTKKRKSIGTHVGDGGSGKEQGSSPVTPSTGTAIDAGGGSGSGRATKASRKALSHKNLLA